jgi:hypothetical protein
MDGRNSIPMAEAAEQFRLQQAEQIIRESGHYWFDKELAERLLRAVQSTPDVPPTAEARAARFREWVTRSAVLYYWAGACNPFCPPLEQPDARRAHTTFREIVERVYKLDGETEGESEEAMDPESVRDDLVQRVALRADTFRRLHSSLTRQGSFRRKWSADDLKRLEALLPPVDLAAIDDLMCEH